MGKGKKRKAPTAGRDAAQQEPENLFERLSNKKRFDIMGRKVKGETKQVGKLRSAATERRKNTLLVEYRQLRKSNAFIDRRFGEDDEDLTADEKALLRFQKQRLRELAGSKFALPDDDGGEGLGPEERLTHLGRSLEELDGLQEGGWGSDDEGDAALGAELTRDLHFGGGLFEKKAGGSEADASEEPGQRKSKKEVMEEIIAKSKAFKAEKQRQKDEDADQTAALDDQFRELLGDKALLGLMRKKGEKRDSKADTREDAAFDVLTRELVFEAKARPGERTLTAEELAELERQRLEVLEAQRRRRMQEGGDEEGDEEEGEGAGSGAANGAPMPAGGYAARRAKRARAQEAGRGRLGDGMSGDALEDDFLAGSDDDDSGDGDSDEGSGDREGDEDEELGRPLTKLERRRRERAAGQHPLRDAFRDAAARLLKKHTGVDIGSGSESGEEESGEESEEGGEEESAEVSGSGSEDGEDGAEGTGGEDEDVAAEADEAELPQGSSDEEEEEEGEAEEAEEEEQAHRRQRQQPAPAPAAAAAGGPAPPPGVSADLPYTPQLPDSYEAFARLAAGRGPADLSELVRRIRVVHARQLGADSRKGLQLLYGFLVQHFASLAGGGGGGAPPLAHLDALVPHLVELTPQVPFYAATLARARLQKAQGRLAERLRDPDLRVDAWPEPRVLLLLKLFATVFPASDKRHPVLTPAGLLVGSCLSNCPLARPQHAATGLYLASLAVHLNSQAQRYAPEPLGFATLLLQSALPAGAMGSAPPPASHQRSLAADDPRWLAVGAGDEGADALPLTANDIEPLELARVLGSSGGDEAYWRSAAFKTSAAAAAARLVGRCAELLQGCAALPEAFAPALAALRAIVGAAEAAAEAAAAERPPLAGKKHKKRGKQAAAAQQALAAAAPWVVVAPGLAALCREVAERVGAAAEVARSSRRPLYNAALLRLAERKQYNPRFEEDFVSGKDYDPDRERAERRKLQRAIKQEERGAARELRRDAAFMAEVRDREKAAKQAELFASEKRAKSFLQQQEADFKSGGQGGMWKRKRKK